MGTLTLLTIQQREDTRRNLAEGMKFVLLIFEWEKVCVLLTRRSEQNSAKTKIWKMVEGGHHCCQSLMGVIRTGASISQVNTSKLIRPVTTVDLQESPDSRERTRAPVLWLSCESPVDVCELFSDNSSLRTILNRQGLLVAAPVVLRTK